MGISMERAMRILRENSYSCIAGGLVKFPLRGIKARTLAGLRKRGMVEVLDYHPAVMGRDFPAGDRLVEGTIYWVRLRSA